MNKKVLNFAYVFLSSLMILCFAVYMFLKFTVSFSVVVSGDIGWTIFRISVLLLHVILLYLSDSMLSYVFSFIAFIPILSIFAESFAFKVIVLAVYTALYMICKMDHVKKVGAILNAVLFILFLLVWRSVIFLDEFYDSFNSSFSEISVAEFASPEGQNKIKVELYTIDYSSKKDQLHYDCNMLLSEECSWGLFTCPKIYSLNPFITGTLMNSDNVQVNWMDENIVDIKADDVTYRYSTVNGKLDTFE